MNGICRNCVRRFNCVGMQFDFFSQSYVCPHNMVRTVTNNRTSMTDDTYLSNGTGGKLTSLNSKNLKRY